MVRYQPPQEFPISAGGGALGSLDRRIRLQVPPSALPENAIFRYTRLERPTDLPYGFHYVGAHFRLEARRAGSGQPLERFSTPLSLALAYQDFEWQDGDILQDSSLMLFRRTPGGGWEAVTGNLQAQANHLTAALDLLSEFLHAGRPSLLERIFLPFLVR